MKKSGCLLLFILGLGIDFAKAQPQVLHPDSFKHYIDSFNKNDDELYKGSIPNEKSWSFLSENIPFLDCPDKVLEETYYFRWWTFRKHIVKTPRGYIITEFLPKVAWSGKYNGISCPAAFHFYEGRWLHDRKYLNQYAHYWFGGGGEPRAYSFWAADAIYNFCLISNDFSLAKTLLPGLVKNYSEWEKSNLDSTGLFWQSDDRDGMEMSVCGEKYNGIGYRPTINSYMYGDARAIAKIARLSNRMDLALAFEKKAQLVKDNLQQKLWDKNAVFYKVLPRGPKGVLCTARELIGYTPWYFNLPDSGYSEAWKFLMDTAGFYAPYGPTTVEQRDPGFTLSYAGHECQWNGPSWPYATSITLTGLANLLNSSDQKFINSKDYRTLLHVYAHSQKRIREDGKTVPWIDENLNPYTGDWISRTRLKTWKDSTWSPEAGGRERGKDYNHSTFCDLIISGLIGLRPGSGNTLVINPLVAPEQWDYFCLDNIPYHGKIITVLYDRTGEKYRNGKGLSVYVNGKRSAALPVIGKMTVAF